jgi:hypothetical protein
MATEAVRYVCPVWCDASDHERTGTYNPYAGADEPPFHEHVVGVIGPADGTQGVTVQVSQLDSLPVARVSLSADHDLTATQALQVGVWLTEAARIVTQPAT